MHCPNGRPIGLPSPDLLMHTHNFGIPKFLLLNSAWLEGDMSEGAIGRIFIPVNYVYLVEEKGTNYRSWPASEYGAMARSMIAGCTSMLYPLNLEPPKKVLHQWYLGTF